MTAPAAKAQQIKITNVLAVRSSHSPTIQDYARALIDAIEMNQENNTTVSCSFINVSNLGGYHWQIAIVHNSRIMNWSRHLAEDMKFRSTNSVQMLCLAVAGESPPSHPRST